MLCPFSRILVYTALLTEQTVSEKVEFSSTICEWYNFRNAKKFHANDLPDDSHFKGNDYTSKLGRNHRECQEGNCLEWVLYQDDAIRSLERPMTVSVGQGERLITRGST